MQKRDVESIHILIEVNSLNFIFAALKHTDLNCQSVFPLKRGLLQIFGANIFSCEQMFCHIRCEQWATSWAKNDAMMNHKNNNKILRKHKNCLQKSFDSFDVYYLLSLALFKHLYTVNADDLSRLHTFFEQHLKVVHNSRAYFKRLCTTVHCAR